MFPRTAEALGTTPNEENAIGRGSAEGDGLHCQIASSHPDEHLEAISTGEQLLVAFVERALGV